MFFARHEVRKWASLASAWQPNIPKGSGSRSGGFSFKPRSLLSYVLNVCLFKKKMFDVSITVNAKSGSPTNCDILLSKSNLINKEVMPLRLHIISWNILAPVYVKCKYYKSTTCQELSIQTRRPKIYRMMTWMNADVYLLQEVTQTEFRKFQMYYPTYHWFFRPHAFHYWKESSAHEWNGNAVAIKKSLKIQSLTQHSLRLSKGNRGLLVKGILNGQHLSFVSIHLDDNSDHCRKMQSEELLEALNQKSTLIVVGGDLNDEYGTVVKHFQQYGFQTSHPKPTYFEESPMALDYLMILNSPHKPFWYVPPSDRTHVVETFGSDHLPVTGIINLT